MSNETEEYDEDYGEDLLNLGGEEGPDPIEAMKAWTRVLRVTMEIDGALCATPIDNSIFGLTGNQWEKTWEATTMLQMLCWKQIDHFKAILYDREHPYLPPT